MDYIVVQHGIRKGKEVHVDVVDVGTTYNSLMSTKSQQTKAKRSRWGRKLYKWRNIN